MSETLPQSLASVIGQQTQTSDGADTSSASQQAFKIPSLESLIAGSASGAETSASASGDASLPEGTSAAATVPADSPPAGQSNTDVSGTQQTTAQTQAQAAEQARLRALLSSRGFDIPETHTTDDAIADLIAQQLDAAASLESSPDYVQFQQWKAQQSAQASPPATPVQPLAATAPAAQPEIPDSVILNSVNNGFITHDSATRKWVPANPAFASHADAMNARAEKQQQAKIQLSLDPEAYIQQRINEALAAAEKARASASQPQSEELKSLLDSMKQQQIQTQISQVEAWAQANSSRLFDATGNQTPFYMLYQTAYNDLTKLDPTYDQRPLERHNEVLKRIQTAEAAFRPTALVPTPVTQQQAKPQQSFLSNVAQRTGENRLSSYDGPARNSVSPQIPRGPGGVPSLSGIINGQTSLAMN